MKNKILSFLKYMLFLSIGIVLLWLAFRNQDFNKIRESLRTAHYGWIGLSVFLSFFAFVSRAYRWNMLIKPLGYKPSLANSTYSLMVGYLANFAIPRIGEVTRCAMLNKSEKIPMDKLIGTVIAERAFDFFTLLVILAFLAITQFSLLGGFLMNQLISPFLEKVTGNKIFLILALLALSIGIFSIWYFLFKNGGAANENTLKGKVAKLVKSVRDGILSVFRLENNLEFIGHTVFIWTIYLFATYVVFFALEPTSHLSLNTGLFVLAIGGLGMTAPVQGGIGAFHWLVSQGLILFGVAFEDGLIFATIIHASQTIFIILFGGVSYLILLSKGKDQDITTKT